MSKKVTPVTLVLTGIILLTCSLGAPIVHPDELDARLEVIYSPNPEYPEQAREQEMEGTVTIEATVRVDGTVQSVVVEKSSGYRELDKAAKDAAKDWMFTEPTRDGEPVRTWILISFTFTLN